MKAKLPVEALRPVIVRMGADHELSTPLGFSLYRSRSNKSLSYASVPSCGHDEEMMEVHTTPRKLSVIQADKESVALQATISLCHKGDGPRR